MGELLTQGREKIHTKIISIVNKLTAPMKLFRHDNGANIAFLGNIRGLYKK